MLANGASISMDQVSDGRTSGQHLVAYRFDLIVHTTSSSDPCITGVYGLSTQPPSTWST